MFSSIQTTNMQNTVRDYQADKSKNFFFYTNFLKIKDFILKFEDKIKDFLNEFEIDSSDGYKVSKYAKQLVFKWIISLLNLIKIFYSNFLEKFS